MEFLSNFWEYFQSNPIIFAAILATLGWIYTSRRARTLAKKQHTINIMLKANFDAYMRKSHREISKYLTKGCDLPDLKETENKELGQHVRFILNHYEFVSAGIRAGDIHETLVKDSERGTIVKVYKCAKDYIYLKREDRPSQSLYEHLEWLHKRWDVSPPKSIQLICETAKGSPFFGARNKTRE